VTQSLSSDFISVIFIKATPEAVWEALTDPAITRRYWFGMHQETDWRPGSPWRMVFEDGRIADSGRVIKADAPRHMIIEWQNQFRDELRAEGMTRCTYQIEPKDEMVKLTITHQSPLPNSKFIEAVSSGWPIILANLKSLLENGGLPRQPAEANVIQTEAVA